MNNENKIETLEKKQKPGKARLFLENMLIYGVGGVISKLIPLIMLPIITRLMPDTTYFGLSDLSNTVMSFGSALAVIGMYDAMFRMFFEKEDLKYKKQVCSTVIYFTSAMAIIVTVLMILGKSVIAKYFFGSTQYEYLVYITAASTLIGATNQIVSAPTRMQNQRRIYLATNTIAPILSYAISIPLILRGYYVIALPVAALISGAFIEIVFGLINRKWFALRLFDIKLLKQLLIIAIPLFPNFLIYWVFNSSDKVMITNLINVGSSGIYAVGSKLGHCSQLIYTAFAGGWQFFAFSTMKEENQVESNSRIFEYLGIVTYFISVFVFAQSYPLFELLFDGDYVRGYVVAPYLFMAPLIQMLFQVACNQFLVIKKTWPNMFILLGGAVVNVFLNLYLIPLIGIEGAAVATLIGYVFSTVVCCIVLYCMKLMVITPKFIISSIIVLVYVLVWRFVMMDNILFSSILALAVALLLFILYRREFKKVISGIFATTGKGSIKEELKKHISPESIKRIRRYLKYTPAEAYKLNSCRRNVRRLQGKRVINRPIKVAFIVQMAEIWDKQQAIYEAMLADNHFSPELVVVPEFNFVNQTIETDYENNYFLSQYQSTKAYNHGKWINLEDYHFDYIFYPRPYDWYLPEMYRSYNVSRYAKCCYVAYAFWPMAGGLCGYNSFFYHSMYYAFLESAENANAIARLEHNSNRVLFEGYPSLDGVRVEEKYDTSKVLWTPRWNYDKELGGSHFFEYKDNVLNLCENFSDITVYFRPHPLAFQNYILQGMMTEEEVELFKINMKEKGIILDNNTKIEDTFREIGVLISDISSVIIPFFLSEKPVILCISQEKLQSLSDGFRRYLDGLYIASEWTEVLSIYKEIQSGNDYLREKRREIASAVREENKDAANRILRLLERDSGVGG